MIVTRWQLAKTSSSRCEMNRTAAPCLRSARMTSNSRSTSTEVSAAVGSSITITFALKESALAISTICWSATDSPRAGRLGSSSTPSRAKTAVVCRRISARSMRRPAAQRLPADEDVLGDREVGEERRLLVDDRDPRVPRRGGPGEGRRRPVDRQRAAVRPVHAGQDLHQRRLAGAVLAEQRVRLARVQRDGAVHQRMHGTERLARLLAGAAQAGTGCASAEVMYAPEVNRFNEWSPP